MPNRAGVLFAHGASVRWCLTLLLAAQISWAQDPDSAAEAARGPERDDPAARSAFEFLRLRDPRTNAVPRNIRAQERLFSRTIPDKSAALRLQDNGQSPQMVSTSTWNPRGPSNVGGRTRALALDAADPNVILAGGVSGGMWRSTNAGVSWSKVTAVDDLQSVTCLGQDRRAGHRNVWYYGTGELLGNSASTSGDHADDLRGDGIFKSTDGGLSWAQLPSTVSGTPQAFDKVYDYVWNVVTDPSNPSEEEVYAATYGGIRRSSDGGASWTNVLGTGLAAVSSSTFTDIAVTSSGVLYATLSQSNLSGTNAPNRGIYRSTNGTTWTNITPSGFPTAYRRVVIAIAPSNENAVYFLLEAPLSGGLRHKLYRYVYLTGDGSGIGGAWTDRTPNLPAYGGLVGDFDSQGSYDLVIKVKPDNEDAVFVGGVNLYRSTDGFTSETNTSWIGGYSIINNYALYPNHHHDQHAIVFDPTNPLIMYTANDGGVQKTTNCLSGTVVWTWLNNGYTTSQFYSIAVDHGTPGNTVLVGGMQDNGTWWTGSASASTGWLNTRTGDGGFCAVANGRTSYYLSSQYGTTYRYLLNGSGAITGFTRVDPTGGAGYAFISPFVLNPTNDVMMFLAGGGTIWRNSNLTGIPLSSNNTTSVNWTNLTNTGAGGGTVSALAVSTSPANILYYGRSNGKVFRLLNAQSGDPLPVEITGSGFPAGAYVSCIAVDPSNANRLIVVFSNYSVQSIFFSSDGGTSWMPVSGNLEEFSDGWGDGPSCRWATILPGGGYYVGTSTGLYSTAILRGGSTSWVREGNGAIGGVVVDMIDSRPSDGLLAIGTHGGGAFSTNVILSVPPAPILVSPSGVDQPLTTRFRWNPAPLATAYRLELATDSTFAALAASDSTITDTTAGPYAGLTNKTRYYWRVAGRNSLGWGAYTSTGTFTTIVDTPGVPLLLSPANGSVRLPVDALIIWNHAVDGELYGLEVATDSAFGTLAIQAESLTDTFMVLSNLQNGSSYYWRVRAVNVGGTGEYSAARWFSTILAAPVPVGPAPAALYQQLQPKFVWQRVTGSIGYHLEVSTSAFFMTPVHNDSLLNDTSGVPAPLDPAAQYYWHVAGRDPYGDGPWSDTRSFLTIGDLPATPSPIDPPDGSMGVSVVAAVRWSSSPGTRFYHVQIDTTETFSTPGVNDSVVVDTTRSAGALTKNSKYYWRVRAINDLGVSGWSAASAFRTINEIQASVPMLAGWNMRSIPLVLSDYRRSTVYPGSMVAYGYAGTYQEAESLAVGHGYWIKMHDSASAGFLGTPVEQESLHVSAGWNLIGSVGEPFDVSDIVEVPDHIVASSYFRFDLGYVLADTIQPFDAYWVKTTQPGILVVGNVTPPAQPRAARLPLPGMQDTVIFSSSSGERQMLFFEVNEDGSVELGELPPAAPGAAFDVRFGTVERAGALQREIPISLRTLHYPVSVAWGVSQAGISLIADGMSISLRGRGSAVLREGAPALRLRFGETAGLPETVMLDQNYPNPFNPSTDIRYGVPRGGVVQLVVYDMLGREVRRLVSTWQEPGFHTQAFDAGGLAGGLYYYRLSANGVSMTRKLLLLK